MLSDQDKKDMLADARSTKRCQEFAVAKQKRPKTTSTLDEYIAFLMALQEITPFQHKPIITQTSKNLL